LIGEVRPIETMVMRLLDEFVVLLTKFSYCVPYLIGQQNWVLNTIDEVCGWDPRLALSGLLAINIGYGENGEGLYKESALILSEALNTTLDSSVVITAGNELEESERSLQSSPESRIVVHQKNLNPLFNVLFHHLRTI
nr:hypothetical protein [Tanacetum cinerariifolium]